MLDETQSEITIYKNAVEKRDSLSSEDEIMDFNGKDQNDNFFSECTVSGEGSGAVRPQGDALSSGLSSKGKSSEQATQKGGQPKMQKNPAQERAEVLIREAEAAKARIYDVSGNNFNDMEITNRIKKSRIGWLRDNLRTKDTLTMTTC